MTASGIATTAGTPRLAVVQHEDGCPPGRFEGWLGEAGATVSVLRPDRGEALPAPGSIDGLVVLGGSMSATDDDRCPWLPAVRSLLGEAVGARLPTLGVCLGHQLLAVAAGGAVAPNPAGRQLGVRPVGLRPPAQDDLLLGPLAGDGERLSVHWNRDVVVEAPPGAVVLAVSPDGALQAFRVGERAWGVQFHPEVDGSIVRSWAERDGTPPGHHEATLDGVRRRAGDLEATGRALATTFAGIVAGTVSPRP